MTKQKIQKPKRRTIDYHAKLIIYDLPGTLKSIRSRLTEWLNRISKELKREKDPNIFAKIYTAKLMK